jgi:hypothetical protein
MKNQHFYLNSFLLITSLCFSSHLQAQISKGAVVYDGNATFKIDNSNTSLADDSNFKKSASSNLSIESGKMVSSRLMLTGELGFKNYNYSHKYTNYFTNESESYSTNESKLNAGFGLRYYLGVNAKTALFAFARYNYAYQEKTALLVGGTTTNFPAYYGNEHYWKLGFGHDLMLSPSLALETTLWYENLRTTSNRGYDILSLGFELKKFNLGKLKSDVPEGGFLHKGRQRIGGSIQVAFALKSVFGVLFNPQYGYMISNKMMIGVSTNDLIFAKGYNESKSIPYVFTRYYLPIANQRLFLSTDLGTDFIGLEARLGATYFLDSNLAIESTLLRYHKSFINFDAVSNDRNYLNVQIGLKYFIK